MPHSTTDHVFMSYSRRDEIVMRRIVTFLRKQGINVWLDNEKLVPGTPIWEAEIEKAIFIAGAVVVLLSPDSKNSPWVRREISYAEDNDKRIFPVFVAGNSRDTIPIRLTNHQRIDIRENEEAGLNFLAMTLSFYLDDLQAQEKKALEEVEKLSGAEVEWQAKAEAKRLADEKAEAERLATQKAEQQAAREQVEVKNVKALVQQNINLRRNASLIKEDPNPSKPDYIGHALVRIKDLIFSMKGKPSVQPNMEQEAPLGKRILLFLFWLLITLLALPSIDGLSSLINWQLQNIVLLFWVLVIIFGAIGASRGWRRESIVLLAAILGLAFNHIMRKYIVLLPETDISLFWLRFMTLELFLYLGYQFGRRISRYSSKAIADNPFQEKLLSATLGAFNGYLIAGAALYYYFIADYPLPLVIVKTADPMLMQRINQLMIYMPPQILGEPGIYFAVIIAVLFVLIILN